MKKFLYVALILGTTMLLADSENVIGGQKRGGGGGGGGGGRGGGGMGGARPAGGGGGGAVNPYGGGGRPAAAGRTSNPVVGPGGGSGQVGREAGLIPPTAAPPSTTKAPLPAVQREAAFKAANTLAAFKSPRRGEEKSPKSARAAPFKGLAVIRSAAGPAPPSVRGPGFHGNEVSRGRRNRTARRSCGEVPGWRRERARRDGRRR